MDAAAEACAHAFPPAILHAFVISVEEKQKEKKKSSQIVNTLAKYGVDWHLQVCEGIKGNYHQTSLNCENENCKKKM